MEEVEEVKEQEEMEEKEGDIGGPLCRRRGPPPSSDTLISRHRPRRGRD